MAKASGNSKYKVQFSVVEFVGDSEELRTSQDFSLNFDVKGIDLDFLFQYEQKAGGAAEYHPEMKIDKVNQFGEVTVSFNETMILPKNWEQINSTDLEIKTVAFNEDMIPYKGISKWSVESFAAKTMTIRLTFEYPLRISDEIEGKDTLQIKVLNPTQFLSDQSFTTVKNETLLSYKLPQ